MSKKKSEKAMEQQDLHKVSEDYSSPKSLDNKSNSNKKVVIVALLISIIVIICGITVYKYLSTKSTENTNKSMEKSDKRPEDDIVPDIVYTYYDSFDVSKYKLIDNKLYEIQGFQEGKYLTNGNGVKFGKFSGDRLTVLVNYDEANMFNEKKIERVWVQKDGVYHLLDAKDPEDRPYAMMKVVDGVLYNISSWYYKDKNNNVFYHSYVKTKSGKAYKEDLSATADNEWVISSQSSSFDLTKKTDKRLGVYWEPDLVTTDE